MRDFSGPPGHLHCFSCLVVVRINGL